MHLNSPTAPLRAENVQVVFLEMQPQIIASSNTVPAAVLRRSAAVVTRLADALEIPIVASIVPLSEAMPELIPELAANSPLCRRSMSLFGDEAARNRLANIGRKVIALAGVSAEIALLRTALDARHAGFDVHLLTDCCGGLSSRGEEGALQQMMSAGVVRSSISSFFSSLVDDLSSEAGRAVMGGLARLWSGDTGGENTEQKVTRLFAEMSEAWRARDAARFAAIFAPKARFVAFDGAVLDGPDAIAAYHVVPFKTYLAGTSLVLKLLEVRSLLNVSIVSSEGGIVREGDASGDLAGLSAQTFVLAEGGDALQVHAFQNTRVRPIDDPETAEIWKSFDRAWFAQPRVRRHER